MPDHVHDFQLVTDGPDCEECQYRALLGMAKCECGEILGPTVIEARINAAERLSAEDARIASGFIQQILEWAVPQLLGKKPNITHSELMDYASALEGE